MIGVPLIDVSNQVVDFDCTHQFNIAVLRSVTIRENLEDAVKIAFIDELELTFREPFESGDNDFDCTDTREIVELISDKIFWNLNIQVLSGSLFNQDLIVTIVEV